MKKTYLIIGKHKINITEDLQGKKITPIVNFLNMGEAEFVEEPIDLRVILSEMKIRTEDLEKDEWDESVVFSKIEFSSENTTFHFNESLIRNCKSDNDKVF